ncbi:hypothetical protein C8J57DRAFT_1235867 [Mycena rebaudengoi]|nr:hypothetical protein C8J57DRAFT_1235867 [Mycena rebaudengoi]
MQLSLSFLTLAFLSFSASAAPSANETEPTNDLVKRSVHCETSGGSPDTGDARAAAQWLQNIHQNSPDTDNCCQNNAGGSLCTEMHREGTACVGICSNSIFSFPGCMSCVEAGNGLLDIANSCSSFGRSGGWADAPFELRLIIVINPGLMLRSSREKRDEWGCYSFASPASFPAPALPAAKSFSLCLRNQAHHASLVAVPPSFLFGCSRHRYAHSLRVGGGELSIHFTHLAKE